MDEVGRSFEWHHLEAAPLLYEQEVYKRSWRRTRSSTVIDIRSVCVWTRNRGSLCLYLPPCWARFFLTHTRVFQHESSDMFCNNSHYGERAQVLDTVKQCRPFRDPTGICVILHSSSYWDQVWAVSSCCWPLWKVTVGCRYAARYLNLANEPVLLVWIRSLGLNNDSENREQQVCTNVKTCVDLLWR